MGLGRPLLLEDGIPDAIERRLFIADRGFRVENASIQNPEVHLGRLGRSVRLLLGLSCVVESDGCGLRAGCGFRNGCGGGRLPRDPLLVVRDRSGESFG